MSAVGEKARTIDAVTRQGEGVERVRPVPPPARSAAARQLIALLGQPRRSSEVKTIKEGQRAPVVLDRDTLFRRLLALADVAAAGLALNVAILAGGDTPTFAVALSMPLVVVIIKVAGLYDRDEHLLHKTTLDEAPGLFQVATMYALMAWLLGGVFAQGEIERTQVLGLWGLVFAAMLVARACARQLALRLSPPERCLVLGDRLAAEEVCGKFEQTHSLRAEVIGRVPMHETVRESGGPPLLGPLDDLDYVLREHRIDRVIIAPGAKDSDELLDKIRIVKALGVKVSLLPRLFEVVGSSVEFDDVGGVTLLGLRRYGLTKSSWYLKRSLDVAGALSALVALAPLLMTIAISIKLGSRGPVLFKQRRIGRDGQAFWMLKFRTMDDGADAAKAELRGQNEAEGLFKIADDPRVTSFGRALRRCSLDEIPQLVNVLRGEMSLVGPRPLVAEEDERIEGWQRRRLDLVPGMTGVWQVLGSSRIPLNEMVKVDYLYRANWSLWLDVKILLRTVGHVAARRGM